MTIHPTKKFHLGWWISMLTLFGIYTIPFLWCFCYQSKIMTWNHAHIQRVQCTLLKSARKFLATKGAKKGVFVGGLRGWGSKSPLLGFLQPPPPNWSWLWACTEHSVSDLCKPVQDYKYLICKKHSNIIFGPILSATSRWIPDKTKWLISTNTHLDLS